MADLPSGQIISPVVLIKHRTHIWTRRQIKNEDSSHNVPPSIFYCTLGCLESIPAVEGCNQDKPPSYFE